jgi:hypothetical protein
MRRTTLGVGTSVATAVTASALSILTTVTLVAGGIVVSQAFDTGRDDSLAALPSIGSAPVAPIVIAAGEPAPTGTFVPSVAAEADGVPTAIPGTTSRPEKAVSLVDVDRVRGTVVTALDPGDPTRMEEVGTIERVVKIIEDTKTAHSTSEEGDTGGTEVPDGTTSHTIDGPVAAGEVVGTEEQTYSDSEGVASPSA